MAFPTTALPVTVEIAPGADPAGDPGTWSWVDITSSVRLADRIHITQGRPDEAGRVDPSVCRLRLDNRTGDFTPRNPLGAYYGTLGRNTPLRVRLQWAKDAFGRTVSSSWDGADSGQTWTTTGGSASDYSVSSATGRQTNDTVGVLRHALLDVGRTNARVRVGVRIDTGAVTGASASAFVAGRVADTSNYYAAAVAFTTADLITLAIIKRVTGSLSGITSTITILSGFGAGTNVVVDLDVSGSTIRAKAWVPGAGQVEPADYQLSVTEDVPSLTAGTNIGCLSRLEGGNTNGTVQFQWSDLTVTNDRFSGFVSSWPPRWDKSGRDATVPIEANGVLRRLGQGASPLRSPLYREIVRSEPTAYWSLEDGERATTASSPITGVGPMAVSGQVQFASDSGQAGSDALPDFTGGGVLTGSVGVGASSTEWRAEFVARFGIGSDTISDVDFHVPVQLLAPTGNVNIWELLASTGEATVQWSSEDGSYTGLLASGVAVDDGLWHHFRIEAEQVGGNISLTFHIDGVQVGTSSLVGKTLGPVRTALVNPLAEKAAYSASVGHLAVWAPYNPPVVCDTAWAATGWAGEAATDRLVRLCDEEDVSLTIPAVSADFETPMGQQPVGTLLDLLRECEEADQGLLYESGFGLGYVPREARYNRAVSLALDFDLGQIAEPPEPTDDDQQPRNRWTVKRRGGDERTAEDADSIAAVGLYDDSIEVNHADDSLLADHASWRVHLGT